MGVLAGLLWISYPTLNRRHQEPGWRIAKARVEMEGISAAIRSYYSLGRSFRNESDIPAGEAYRALTSRDDGPLIESERTWEKAEAFVDPWGAPYLISFHRNGENETLVSIRSTGPNGVMGEAGQDDLEKRIMLPK